jgi:hypothetical protein
MFVAETAFQLVVLHVNDAAWVLEGNVALSHPCWPLQVVPCRVRTVFQTTSLFHFCTSLNVRNGAGKLAAMSDVANTTSPAGADSQVTSLSFPATPAYAPRGACTCHVAST